MVPGTKRAVWVFACGVLLAGALTWRVTTHDVDAVATSQSVHVPRKPAIENAETQARFRADETASAEEFAEIAVDSIHRKRDGDVIAQWGEFVVFQRVATNCRFDVFRTDELDLPSSSVWRCDTITVPDHPYADFTNEQLRQISESDGAAALILGKRLRDSAETIESYQEAIQYLYSAVALSGEPDVFEILMDEQGIRFGTHSNNPAQDLADKSETYVWAKAGNDLGLVSSQRFKQAKGAIQAIDPNKIDELDQAATQLAAAFQEERIELTGERFQ